MKLNCESLLTLKRCLESLRTVKLLKALRRRNIKILSDNYQSIFDLGVEVSAKSWQHYSFFGIVLLNFMSKCIILKSLTNICSKEDVPLRFFFFSAKIVTVCEWQNNFSDKVSGRLSANILTSKQPPVGQVNQSSRRLWWYKAYAWVRTGTLKSNEGVLSFCVGNVTQVLSIPLY